MKLLKKKKEQQQNKETPQEKQEKVTIPIEETKEYKQNNCIT